MAIILVLLLIFLELNKNTVLGFMLAITLSAVACFYYLYFYEGDNNITIIDGQEPIIKQLSKDKTSKCKEYSYDLATQTLKVCN